MKSGGEKGMGMEVDFPARIVRIGEIEEGGDELDEGSREIETSRCGARMEKLIKSQPLLDVARVVASEVLSSSFLCNQVLNLHREMNKTKWME